MRFWLRKNDSRSKIVLPSAVVAACAILAAIVALGALGTSQAATPTTPNLALGRPVIASSSENSSLTAGRAADGNTGTRWSSKWSDPQWIYVDLGQATAISRIVLRWETAYAKAFQLQVSNDAAGWTTIYSTASGTGGMNDLAVNGTGRYVRMYGTKRGTAWGYSLWEFEAYGSPPLTIAPVETPIIIPATSTPVATAIATSTPAVNRALNRPATASSNETTALTPNLAVDGTSATRWSSMWSDPQWLSVDLGQPYAISGVRLSWETAFGKAYQIQLSNDGTNWTTIYNTTTGTGGVNDLAVSGIGRYVRMYGTMRGTAWGYSLLEMAVFGTATQGQLPIATSTPAPTATPAAPTATATAVPAPVATATPVPATPTVTATAVPPTPTATATAVPPTPTSVASANPMPMGQSGAWNLVFRDEFSGAALDGAKWVTCYPWFSPSTGCTNTGNKELQWYLPSGVSVSDGLLKLTAIKQSIAGTNGITYPYTSGMVSTGPSGSLPPKFSYQYGFIEARMKLPGGRGVWPAFWTLPNDRSWPPEVDAMELWGQNPNQIMMNYHWKDGAGVHQQSPTMVSGDFTTNWHTIGMSWAPGSLVYYVDGVAKKTVSNSYVPAKPMYIILNLAIDGGSAPDASTAFPATMQVDYVRAWTR